MQQRRNSQKAKLVVRSGSLGLKLVVIVLIVLSMAALIALSCVHTAISAQTETLRQEALSLETDNARLELRLENPDSVQNILAVASEELGIVNPNTVFIRTVTAP